MLWCGYSRAGPFRFTASFPERGAEDKAAMPRDGAIVFGDLIGKFDMLRIECATQGVIQAPRLEPANHDALNTELAFPRLSANRTYVGHQRIDTNVESPGGLSPPGAPR